MFTAYTGLSMGSTLASALCWKYRRQLSISLGNLWARFRERCCPRQAPRPLQDEEAAASPIQPRGRAIGQLRHPIPHPLRILPPTGVAGVDLEMVEIPPPVAEEAVGVVSVPEEPLFRRSGRRRIANVRLLDYEWAGKTAHLH